jgi:hypothetical protein
VQLQARDRDAAVVQPAAATTKHASAHEPVELVQLERVSFLQPVSTQAAPPRESEDDPGSDDDLAEGGSAESEGELEPAESEDAAGEQDVTESDGDDGGTNSVGEEAGEGTSGGDSSGRNSSDGSEGGSDG